MRTDVNEFINMAAASGAKFPELVAAQMILESAGGTSESGINNLVGAKATEEEEGTFKETTEVIDGKEVKTVAKFKNYESPQAGIDELVNRWYKDYPGYQGVNNANSLEEAAMMLQQQNYATDPKYAQKLIQIANRFR
jgi:flagellum-specific peptidoglycan hydrolase FlgJ